MNKIILTIAISIFIIPVAGVSAQMMYGAPSSTSTVTNQTLDAGEAAGQAIAQKLQAKTVVCADLSQDNYESLGDYYMGLMMGSSHDSMEKSIEKAYGADYLKSMHIAMGERFSGCNVNVAFPAGMTGFGPMMGGGYNMMGNGGSNGYQDSQGNWQGRGYSMMGWGFPGMMGGYGYGYGVGNTVFTLILWALAIVGLIALIKLIINKNKKQ